IRISPFDGSGIATSAHSRTLGGPYSVRTQALGMFRLLPATAGSWSSACYVMFHVRCGAGLASTRTRRFGGQDVPRPGKSLGSTQMARKRKQREESAFSKLTPAQQRAWLAFIRLRLRLSYEMNRQLQAESNLSLADYDVLNALRYEPEGWTQITALAIRIGW